MGQSPHENYIKRISAAQRKVRCREDDNYSNGIIKLWGLKRTLSYQKIFKNPGNSTLLFHDLVLFFRVSDKRHNKCSKDSFIQILQLS